MKNHSAVFRLVLCVWFFAFIFTSCIIDIPSSNRNKQSSEKAYRAKILWKTEIYYSRHRFDPSPLPLVDGQYCYFPADNYGGYVLKIDLETGKVMWESERGYSVLATPQKIEDRIYLMGESGFVSVYNDSDGKLAATIRLGDNETDASDCAIRKYSSPVITVSGHWLFWANDPYSDDCVRGLMRLDSRKIDFAKDPDEVQSITPDLVWSTEWRARISTNIISEDGIIYFLTEPDSHSSPEHESILAAMNTQTNEIIWERDMSLFIGQHYFGLILDGEKLIVAERNIFCGNKNTGVQDYLVFNDLYSLSDATSNNNRIILNNKHLYFNETSRITSVDAVTGIASWRTPFDWDDKIFYSSPLIHNGRIFVLHGSGLRVYNADNGDFIGIDRSFKTDYGDYDEIAIYKDAFIFVDKTDKTEVGDFGSAYLTSIRCN